MTTAMRRTIAMIAVTTVFVTGCSTGQGDPKVAATVGSTNVSTVEQVQQRLNDLLARNPQAQEAAKQHKLDQVARGIVTQDVLHVLAADAAKRANITVDESVLAQLVPALTGAPATGGDPFLALVEDSFPAIDLARDRLIMGELGRQALGKTLVTIDGAILTDGDEARNLAKQLAADPGNFGNLVKGLKSQVQDPIVDQKFGALPADVPPESAGDALSQVVSTNALPFMAAPVNTVLMWRISNEQQGGYAVVHVKNRAPAPPTTGLDLSQVKPAQLIAVGQTQLLGSAYAQGVKPNQRYGSWDPVTLKVVSSEEASVSSMFLTATAKKP